MYVSGYLFIFSVEICPGRKKIKAIIRDSLGKFKLFRKLQNFKKISGI